jgi:uncharacterized protein YegP (UPF0339 family)
MATATKKARASKQLPRLGGRVSGSPVMEFLVFRDNGGSYRWTISAGNGEQLAQSASFASYEDARDAAGRVRDGAGSARLEDHEAAAVPVDVSARREAAARDDVDAERWLDEGGSYTAAVAVELPETAVSAGSA